LEKASFKFALILKTDLYLNDSPCNWDHLLSSVSHGENSKDVSDLPFWRRGSRKNKQPNSWRFLSAARLFQGGIVKQPRGPIRMGSVFKFSSGHFREPENKRPSSWRFLSAARPFQGGIVKQPRGPIRMGSVFKFSSGHFREPKNKQPSSWRFLSAARLFQGGIVKQPRGPIRMGSVSMEY